MSDPRIGKVDAREYSRRYLHAARKRRQSAGKVSAWYRAWLLSAWEFRAARGDACIPECCNAERAKAVAQCAAAIRAMRVG